jgi:hypothetical protein
MRHAPRSSAPPMQSANFMYAWPVTRTCMRGRAVSVQAEERQCGSFDPTDASRVTAVRAVHVWCAAIATHSLCAVTKTCVWRAVTEMHVRSAVMGRSAPRGRSSSRSTRRPPRG